jgi:hypothetical protein
MYVRVNTLQNLQDMRHSFSVPAYATVKNDALCQQGGSGTGVTDGIVRNRS